MRHIEQQLNAMEAAVDQDGIPFQSTGTGMECVKN